MRNPEYTRKRTEQAIDDCRYLARREGANAWTVEVAGRPGIFENFNAEACPLGRNVQAGWSPDGRRLDIGAAGAPPRACLKTYDVYDRSRVEEGPVTQVKGQTRGAAASAAGPNSKPDNRRKAWHVNYRAEGLPGVPHDFADPYLCEVIARTREDAEREARNHFTGTTQTFGGIERPTDLERLIIRRACEVIDQEEGGPIPVAENEATADRADRAQAELDAKYSRAYGSRKVRT